MAEDEDLRKNGLKPPGVPGAGPREGAVIFKLAAEMESGVSDTTYIFILSCSCELKVETVSLANNKLTSAHSLVHIGRYLPKLANLSLQNNQLSRMRDLDFLSGPRQGPVKLPNLRELVLLGNPLRDDLAKAGKLDTYKQYDERG
jgi:nuclear RNA export factor